MRFPHSGQAAALLLILGACGPATVPEPPQRADLAAQIVTTAPEADQGNICWAKDTLPAVVETVTEQVADRPAAPDASGKARPVGYSTVTQQKIVSDRRLVWFRAPCPEVIDADFVATLQRALKARGYYKGGLSGRLDGATGAAVRRFQTARGLNSAWLSLAAAKELGIVVTGLDEL